MSKPETLKKGMSQLLVEGVDAKIFCIWACAAYNFEHIQVQDFGGIKDLDNFLSLLTVLPNYQKVPAILIVRDAETNSESAIQSIKSSLEKNNFCVPAEPYNYCQGQPSTEFAILPGNINSNGKYSSGALEDLCMLTVKNSPLLEKVDEFLTLIQKETPLTHFHKSRLHSYLSVNNKFVGMKIGEAAKAGAWNWEHSALSKLKKAMSDVEQAAIAAL